MDLTISSKKIGNPLLVELLRKLTVSFNRMHREFYVIGATARDIILKQVVGSESKRRTMDLGIAMAISRSMVLRLDSLPTTCFKIISLAVAPIT